MRHIDVVSINTGEVLAVFRSRYDSRGTVFSNVQRWMRRHPNLTYANLEDQEAAGVKWNESTYWVKEI